jgi:hypothetical protein
MNKLFRFYFILFIFPFPSILSAQEISKGDVYQYARKIVDTMTSDSMHGRGYVNDGVTIAANYIQSEFKNDGLKSFTDDYYQKFSFAVNSLPGPIKFDIYPNNKATEKSKFEVGKNCLISAGAQFIQTPFQTIYFDSLDATDAVSLSKFRKGFKKQNTFIVIDSRGVYGKYKKEVYQSIRDNLFDAAGVIEVVDKLTWEPSQAVKKYQYVQVLPEVFDLKETHSGMIYVSANKFYKEYPSSNVIGYVSGSDYPDSFIVFTAHYDHLGQMGKDVYFPGANDNASGCAMLLNLAKYYYLPENRPKYSIAFIAFCGEEVGLLGSKYYVEHPLFPLSRIRFLLNMDIMGTGEEGITVVNGTIFKSEFDKLKEINTKNNFIKDVKIRGKAANSDHYPFSEKGIHACFIYTMGGIKAYHDIYDRGETLPLNEFEHLFKLITTFESELEHR